MFHDEGMTGDAISRPKVHRQSDQLGLANLRHTITC